jgi:hypothetical protein
MSSRAGPSSQFTLKRPHPPRPPGVSACGRHDARSSPCGERIDLRHGSVLLYDSTIVNNQRLAVAVRRDRHSAQEVYKRRQLSSLGGLIMRAHKRRIRWMRCAPNGRSHDHVVLRTHWYDPHWVTVDRRLGVLAVSALSDRAIAQHGGRGRILPVHP